jgi:hypothetical protein
LGLRGSGARPGDRTRARAGSTGTRRPGAAGKPASAPTAPPQQAAPTTASKTAPRTAKGTARQRASVTSRAIALAVVLLILTISYASSLRVYITQQDINNLSDEISRWNDPNYVRTQARIRLGWVLPGERGYRVIGADGKPIGGGVEISGDPTSRPAPAKPWYSKLMGSVQAADHPEPAVKDPADQPPITEKTKPGTSSGDPAQKPTGKPTR